MEDLELTVTEGGARAGELLESCSLASRADKLEDSEGALWLSCWRLTLRWRLMLASSLLFLSLSLLPTPVGFLPCSS